jgi:hypothetical protein
MLRLSLALLLCASASAQDEFSVDADGQQDLLPSGRAPVFSFGQGLLQRTGDALFVQGPSVRLHLCVARARAL